MYKAMTRFADLNDGNRIYEAGDIYPRPGLVVSEERLAELAGSDNRAGKPLIKAVEAPQTPVEAVAETPMVTPVTSVEAPRKPRRSRKKG